MVLLWIRSGRLAKDVTDCATILEAIASYDEKDSTSQKREDTDFTKALVNDVKGMKIGIPKDYFGEGLDPEVKEKVLAAANLLKEKGAVIEEFELSTCGICDSNLLYDRSMRRQAPIWNVSTA